MPPTSNKRQWHHILLDLGEFIVELVKVVLISLVIILPVRYYLVQPFYVKGASMEPTFLDHEYLLIDEISYRFEKPKRGEVVVFRYPRDPRQFFIKRIIGLPGETVHIKNGYITITRSGSSEEQVINESYLGSEIVTNGELSVTVPAGYYFLMGDNRNASLDSRNFGPVAERYIVGRVWLRAWPFDRWMTFGYSDGSMVSYYEKKD